MKLRAFLATAMFAGAVFTASAITADEIISKSVTAQGGLEKFKALKTYSASGSMAMSGMDMSFSLKVKRDHKMRLENEMQGMKFTMAVNDKTGWMINPMGGTGKAEALPAEQLKEMRDMADIDGDLVGFAEDGWKVDTAGIVDVDGATAYKLKFTKDKDTKFIYVDATSWLPIKEDKTSNMMGQQTEIETLYTNYQDVGGVLRPFTYEMRVQGQTVQTITLKKVESNIELADSIFVMPK